MELYVKILIAVAILLVIFGGVIGYFYYKQLSQPQLFLVSRPYNSRWPFSQSDVTALTTAFSGTFATVAQLQQAVNSGFYVYKAGYLADLSTPNPGCSDNTCATPPCNQVPPQALYSTGNKTLGDSCSQGYFIFGNKLGTVPTGFTVEPFNQTTGVFNIYSATGFSDFWSKLKTYLFPTASGYCSREY